MKYYVYKITNNINGKWYIGKRKHKFPHQDSYMGSGKLIKKAIEKYGQENFTKQILRVFDDNESAAILEATLVTKEIVATRLTYNMHEGGHGGFAHLNDGSEEHINRSKVGAERSRGRNHPKWGMSRFTKGSSFARECASKANKGKFWIFNPMTGKNKYCGDNNKIPKGWIKGRKIKNSFQRNAG